MDGVNSYRAFYNVGVIYECLGQVDKAKNITENVEITNLLCLD